MGVNGIYGLSGSGLDIESMVKVGMMSKQNEYDKMAQKYTKNEWTKNALIDLNNQITTFNLSSLTDYKLQSNMNAKTATSSNEAAVTATANATSAIMSHKVSVNSLSHNAYLIGSNKISTIIANTQYYSSNHEVTAAEKAEAETLASTANLKDILFKNLTYNDTESVQTEYNNGTLTETLSLSNGKTITIDRNNNTATYSNGSTEYTGSISSDGNTITFNNVGYYSSNLTVNLTRSNGVINSASVTNNGYPSSTIKVSSIKQEYSFSDATNSNQTITIDNSSGTQKASYSNTKSAYGSVSYNGNGTVSGSTISFGNGTTINLDGRTATVTEQTRGLTGNTLGASNGFRNNVSYGYTDGNFKLAQLTDTAIEFTIADSKDSTNTATIKFTYGDLLGDNDTGAKPKTMNDLVSEINRQATNNGINVKATYDNLNGVFSIYNPTSDSDSGVVIKATNNNSNSTTTARTYEGVVTTNFFNALGLKEFDGTQLSTAAKTMSGSGGGDITVTGENGTITVDGMEYKTKDNKVTVGGVTYNFLNTTTDPVTVTVGQDVDAIVDRVKSFVESYNKILGSLYEKYDEKADSNYKPLTQSQKDQMKDEQIEKWEEKAKQGLLYHDQTLSKIINQMRNAISLEVEGIDSKYKSAYSIGIETTGFKGQLKFNEDKLRNALAEDGDAVSKIFTKLDTEAKPNASGIVKENGIAQRLGDILTNATKLIKNRAGSSTDIVEDSELNNLLRELQTKMSNFKKMMNAFEDRLYKKYDAMEVALSKLGTQLNFITGGQ